MILAGAVNLVVGFLSLFPGMFEASASAGARGEDEVTSLLSLAFTPYGRYALAHLSGAALQIAGGGAMRVLVEPPLTSALAALCIVSLGIEVWAWVSNGMLSILSVPGVAAAAFTAILYCRSFAARRSEPRLPLSERHL